ncbi:MAG: sterol desaturase family protein [Actinomycetota bacterium]|nr:sterol desaturase family protein [Actinomycetota bacterium]
MTAMTPLEPPPHHRPVVDRRRRWPDGGHGRRGLLGAGTALALIAASLAFRRDPLFAIVALFVLVVPFEKIFPRHEQKVRRPELGTDVGYTLANPVLNLVGIVAAGIVGVLTLGWLPGLALRPLVSMLPAMALPFIGIALCDLAIYWTHRWYHEVRFLWRFHSIQHSTEHLDWVSGFRNHPLDGTLIAPAFFFLIAAGFSAEFTGALAVIQLVTGLFLRANVRWRLRPLHRVIITPEFYHWHHANEPGAINSNYSVFLPLWDIAFGTYFLAKDRRPQKYGVDEHIPDGMLAQVRHPLRGMGNPLRIVCHPLRSARGGFRFGRSLVADMWTSAKRPRRRADGSLARPSTEVGAASL